MSAFDPRASFRADLCRGCGICSSVCPVSAVNTDQAGRVVSFSSLCIGCGHCGCYCPWNCFELESFDEDHKAPLEETINAIIENRRSSRNYLDKELSEDVVRDILSPVGYSPTGHNDQGIRVTVLLGRDNVRNRVVAPLVRLVRILDRFRLISLLAGPGKTFVKRLREGEDLITWGAPCVLLFRAPWRNVTGAADSVIAASLVSLKAEAMGLGTLWNGVLKILSPYLGLGRASAVLCVGYPGLRKYQKLPEREWKRKNL